MARYVQGKRGWALLGVGLVMLGAVLVSVLAGEEDQSFTATPYADVVRFKANGVASLQVGIYDLSGQELWASGVRTGQIVDWERTNEWGERLAHGVYLYSAQGWDAQGGVVLERSGKLAFLPGDQVQLQVAPSVASPESSDDLAPFEDEPMTVQPKALGETYICSVLGVGTASPDPLAHFYAGSAGSIAGHPYCEVVVEDNHHSGINILSRNDRAGVIYFGDGDNQRMGRITYSHATDTLYFMTSGVSYAMAFDSTGAVGIGTLTPANQLDVSNAGGSQLGLTDPLGPDHWELDAYSWGLDFWDTFWNNPVGFEVGAPDGTLYVAANGGVGIGTGWAWPRGGLEIQCAIANDPNDIELYLAEPDPAAWNSIYFDCTYTDWIVSVDDSWPGLFLIGDLQAPGWGMDLWWNGAWYDMWVYGDIYATGIKFFAEEDPTNPTKVIVYSTLEGPEAGTYVRGSAELMGGEAVIFLPDHFGKVTTAEGLTVVLTPVGEWRQLYVVEKSTSHIVVREATGQDGTFDYLVQGIRTGHEDYQVVRDRAEFPVMEAGERGAPRWPEFPNLDVPQGGGKEERTPPTESE